MITGGIDNGIDGPNSLGRGIQFVHVLDASFLEGHRKGATPNAKRTYTGNGGSQIARGKRLVDEIQSQFPIKEIVKSGSKISGTPRKRHAELGIFIDD